MIVTAFGLTCFAGSFASESPASDLCEWQAGMVCLSASKMIRCVGLLLCLKIDLEIFVQTGGRVGQEKSCIPASCIGECL